MGEQAEDGKRSPWRSPAQTPAQTKDAGSHPDSTGSLMRLLLDTSVLIDVLRLRRGRRELLAELVRGGNTLATTALNVAVLYAGMRRGEEARTQDFLGALDCYELTAA